MNISTTPITAIMFAALSLLFTSTLAANENSRSEIEQANLNKALYCMEILENSPDLAATTKIEILRKECFAENYIQHAPHVADGREAVLSLFANRYAKYPELSMSVKRTATDGDLVWLHLHVKRTPDALGTAMVHIFRMENGKIAEHWGVAQPVPDVSKNSNTMF